MLSNVNDEVIKEEHFVFKENLDRRTLVVSNIRDVSFFTSLGAKSNFNLSLFEQFDSILEYLIRDQENILNLLRNNILFFGDENDNIDEDIQRTVVVNRELMNSMNGAVKTLDGIFAQFVGTVENIKVLFHI